MYGRWPAIRHAWPLVLIIAALQGGGQALVALFDPVLCTFAGGTAALVALYPLSRWRRYARAAGKASPNVPPCVRTGTDNADDRPPPMGLGMSFLPYVSSASWPSACLAIEPINRRARGIPHRPALSGRDNRVRRWERSEEPVFAVRPADSSGHFSAGHGDGHVDGLQRARLLPGMVVGREQVDRAVD